MGINSLNTFLKKTVPSCYKTLQLSEFGGKKVAVDVSIYLYQFKSAASPPMGSTLFRKNRFIDMVLNFCICLLESKIHPLFVFDGTSPAEKIEEQKKRSGRRDTLMEKIESINKLLARVHTDDPLSELIEEYKKLTSKDRDGVVDSTITNTVKFTKLLEYKLYKLSNQNTVVSTEDCNLVRELLDLLGIKHMDAPGEADALCSYLQLEGYVDTVLSNDTDFIAYGVGSILSKLDVKKGEVVSIDYKTILTGTGMESDQFLDFCIMCGTDYNSNIPRVGPAKAYKLISEFKSIDGVMESNKVDGVSELNHKRVREMFRLFPYITDKHLISLPGLEFEQEKVRWKELQEFLFKRNCMYNTSTVKRELNIPIPKLI